MRGRLKILYFAWLREKTGVSQEDVTLPAEVQTVQELIDWLKQRSPAHARAFDNAKLVRCAIDQEFTAVDARLGDASEIAFFPPVTGG
jgi:molybdopterin synthase sulfur carrier subunit